MKDINKVILIGRLGVDPVLKVSKSGMPYAKFTIATNRILKDQPAITQWHKLVIWGKMAENCSRFLKKGQAAYVEGELRSNDYEDKDGIARTSFDVHVTEISFLGYPRLEKATTLLNAEVETSTEAVVQ